MTLRKAVGIDPTFGTPSEISATTDTLQIGAIIAGGVAGVAFNANGFSVTGLPAPVNPSDATNKAYVDAFITGLSIKASAAALGASNIATLSGTMTVDGVALAANQRILLINQTDPKTNGLWLVGTGAWTRPADFAAGSNAAGTFCFIDGGGAVYGNEGWTCTSVPGSDVVGTASLAYTQFSALGEVTPGTGLSKTLNTLNLVLAANPGLQFTNGGLDHLLQSAGALQKTASGLGVLINDTTTLAASSSGLSVAGVPALFNVAGTPVTANVTAPNLGTLTGGGASFADGLHQHSLVLGSGNICGIHTAGTVALNKADPVQWSSTNTVLQRCDAAAQATSQCIGIAGAAIAANATGPIIKKGIVYGVLTGATAGTPYYLASGGGVTATSPIGAGITVVRVGTAVNATDLEVNIVIVGTRAS